MLRVREVNYGDRLPVLGMVKRKGQSPSHTTRQFIVRFPIWLHYSRQYNICIDEFRTGWWVFQVQITFENGLPLRHFVMRLNWGDMPAFEPKRVTA